MTFATSVAVLAIVIFVVGAVIYALHAPRRRSRKRRTDVPLDALSDPPTITHYGHG